MKREKTQKFADDIKKIFSRFALTSLLLAVIPWVLHSFLFQSFMSIINNFQRITEKIFFFAFLILLPFGFSILLLYFMQKFFELIIFFFNLLNSLSRYVSRNELRYRCIWRNFCINIHREVDFIQWNVFLCICDFFFEHVVCRFYDVGGGVSWGTFSVLEDFWDDVWIFWLWWLAELITIVLFFQYIYLL